MDILLVDDDETVCRTIGRFLTAREHRLRTASSGTDALHRIREQVPDLVLCDIQMPGIDGIGLLQTVREQFPKTTVVLMTAGRNMDTAIAAFRGGAYDLLKKPVRLQELQACIQSLGGKNLP